MTAAYMTAEEGEASATYLAPGLRQYQTLLIPTVSREC